HRRRGLAAASGDDDRLRLRLDLVLPAAVLTVGVAVLLLRLGLRDRRGRPADRRSLLLRRLLRRRGLLRSALVALRLQRVDVDLVRAAEHLVRLAVAGAVERRVA